MRKKWPQSALTLRQIIVLKLGRVSARTPCWTQIESPKVWSVYGDCRCGSAGVQCENGRDKGANASGR